MEYEYLWMVIRITNLYEHVYIMLDKTFMCRLYDFAKTFSMRIFVLMNLIKSESIFQEKMQCNSCSLMDISVDVFFAENLVCGIYRVAQKNPEQSTF